MDEHKLCEQVANNISSFVNLTSWRVIGNVGPHSRGPYSPPFNKHNLIQTLGDVRCV
jgi:hypothetical protein